VHPPNARVARYYCPKGHTTFSLLPDCLASRLSSSLSEVEQVVSFMEDAEGSQEQAAERLRPDIERQGALRWVRRRINAVHVTLVTILGLLPSLLAKQPPTLNAFRAVFGTNEVLVTLREVVALHLASLPPPVGFGPRPTGETPSSFLLQHGTGADPP
jgi:hypothetical protein